MAGKEDKKVETSGSIREQRNISLQCPKLTESNYTQWAILMETILKAYDLWETIDSTEEEDEKKVYTTKAMIFQTLPEDILMQVAQHSTAKEVWDAVKVRYLGADMVQKARLQTLRSELEVLKMKENETVNDFAGKLGGIRAKFKNLGANLKDKVIVRKFLNSLPKKFLPIVASIEQYSDVDMMPFEEAVGRIIAFEERLKCHDEPVNDDQSKLLIASTSNSESWHHGRGRGRESFRGGRGRGRSMDQGNKDKSKFKCYECGEFGHFAYECSKWKNKEKETEQEAHLVVEEEPMLLQVKEVEDLL